MIEIIVPEAGEKHRLPFFLALEEWIAKNMPDSEYFFTWSCDPTVIIGRNQSLETEVDTAYCRDHGIEIYRRRSGGGCVYADRNNLMISYVTPGINVPAIFADYTTRVASAMRRLGVDTEVSGRNDILVGGCKVSGNAYYRTERHSIVHGTMLWQVDFASMAHAITPSRAKLESKRVKSVESRVTGISEMAGDIFGTLAGFASTLTSQLCDSSYTLTSADIEAVKSIEQHYYSHNWLEGTRRLQMSKISSGATAVGARIDGVGEICVCVDTRDNSIYDIDISGDFFALSDPEVHIAERLRGCPVDRESICGALANIDMPGIINGLTVNEFSSLLLAAASQQQN